MVKKTDEKYKQMHLLYEKGERIKSLKQLCKLIINEDCENTILIDFRMKLYSTFISGENGIDDEVLVMFKCAIKKCTFGNSKFNIPFIKKAINYLEQKNNPDYEMINGWLNLYDVDTLNDTVYGNNKYSDKELYYLKKAKTLDLINKEEELDNLLNEYLEENIINDEIIFFIKYHLCRLYFLNKNYEKANKLLGDLLLLKREKYVLGLPIKYLDYTNQEQKIFLIIELLLENYVEDYFFVYIFNWLKESKYKEVYEKIQAFFEYKNGKYNILDYKKIKNLIINYFLNVKNIYNEIKRGKIFSITKSGNAFISNNPNNIFVSNKYVNKRMKKGTEIFYFLIEKYNHEKKCNLIQAIVVKEVNL